MKSAFTVLVCLCLSAGCTATAAAPALSSEFKLPPYRRTKLENGMTLLLTTTFWQRRCRDLDDAAVASELKRLAENVCLDQYKKVARSTRTPPPKRKSSKHTPHVATARLLEKRK